MSFETNANKLPWMQDPYGFVSNLRREGCRSIGRMQGDARKMEVLMDTLRVLAKYAAAKMTEQLVVNEKIRLRRIAATKLITSRNIADANAIENQLQEQLAAVQERLTSIQARKAQTEAEATVIAAGGSSRAQTVQEKQQTEDGIGGAQS